jgi:hypothetical protein
MEPYQHRIKVGRQKDAPIRDLSAQSLVTLLSAYDRVKIAMADGNWKAEIPLPPASAANRGRIVIIDHGASYNSTLTLNGQKVKVSRGYQKSFVSNAVRWTETGASDGRILRKPHKFGVPVVTLVGYYDPAGALTSYIYPALQGVCGFCYPDDSSTLNETDCQLRVETEDGELRFRLASDRLSRDGKVMNKFHINIPASSQPTKVTVVVGDRVLDEKPITLSTVPLQMTVNGVIVPTPRRTQAE